MNLSKEEILEHFRKYIKKWMFNDISRCIKARANYAVAALLMSYTEIVGALINGNLGSRNDLKGNFNAFLEHFDFNGKCNYYKEFVIKESDYPERDFNMYDIVRCGLIHEYFLKGLGHVENDPKQNMSVEYNKNIAGIRWVDDYADGYSGYSQKKLDKYVLVFNTNAYFRDFKNAVEKICKLIESGDAALINNISKSLNRISNRKIYPKLS